jgi:hypothetical protein
MTAALFPLGHVVATPGALRALDAAETLPVDLLRRHQAGDWGDVSAGDADENALSVREKFRVLSAYTLETGDRVWIITEHDRSATTVLLPSEY